MCVLLADPDRYRPALRLSPWSRGRYRPTPGFRVSPLSVLRRRIGVQPIPPKRPAVAARVTLNKVVTFCSIYLPPSDHVAKTDLINLIEQLPSPFILLGDFNGHSPVWANESYNSRGQMLEDLFSEMDLCIVNDGSSTYIHPATGSTSALDLSICGPSLVLDYEWNIHEDLCGSDHFPVILTSNAVEEDASHNRWNFEKADWLSFQTQCSFELTEEAVIPPVSWLTLFKQQAKLYQKHASRKNFPRFRGLMTVAKKQLKKGRKLSKSFFLNQRWVMFKCFNF